MRHAGLDENEIAYAGIGDRENAMRWLGEGFTTKAFSVRYLMNVDWQPFAALKDDPRFVALRKRVLTTTFSD